MKITTMNTERKLSLGILVMKFPNPVQSYINRQIVELLKRKHKVRIYANNKNLISNPSIDIQDISNNTSQFYSNIDSKLVLITKFLITLLLPIKPPQHLESITGKKSPSISR